MLTIVMHVCEKCQIYEQVDIGVCPECQGELKEVDYVPASAQLLREPRLDIPEACPQDRHQYYIMFLAYEFCPYCGERLRS